MINLSNRPVYRYWQSCVGFTGDVYDLMDLDSNGRQITWKTFRQHVATEDLETLFPDYHWKKGSPGKYKFGLHIKDDWAVTFHRSHIRGVPVYYVCHSSIEYIFTKGGRSPYAKN